MALIYCYGDNKLADAMAKDSAELLTKYYPNHSWWVECKQGVLIIKHLEASGMRGLIGMVKRVDSLAHDAKVRHREIVMMAGELLERAGLRRGANVGDPVVGLDVDATLRKHWHRPLRPTKVIH